MTISSVGSMPGITTLTKKATTTTAHDHKVPCYLWGVKSVVSNIINPLMVVPRKIVSVAMVVIYARVFSHPIR